ncbi:MAG: DUF2796 domain-containing protein [Maricaulaceae bacterium]|nr:DUF2796 domain-containing protein [Maricaulaceae bacterium]
MRHLFSAAVSALALAAPAAASHPGHPAPGEAARPDLGPHIHGVGYLAAALDGGMLVVEFQAPGGDLFGIEREPRDGDERAAAAAVLEQVRSGALFAPAAAAGCELVSAEVSAPFLGDSIGPAPGTEIPDHDHSHGGHHGHDHGEAAEERPQQDHGYAQSGREGDEQGGQERSHEAHRHGGGYSDLFVEWTYACAAPARLNQIEAILFQSFDGLARIEAAFIGPQGQRAASLSPRNPRFDVR